MMRKTCALIFLLQLLFIVFLGAQTSGEEIYKSSCAACHTIGKGRLIGPDLSRVYEKRDQEWLYQKIRSSQKLIKEGDSLAVALYEEHNRIPMPDNDLNDKEILNIIDYIRSIDIQLADGSVPQEQVSDTIGKSGLEYSLDVLSTGYALFYGHQHFSNRASSCFACHNIQDEYTIIGGGKLSVDLTDSYSRLGRAGIKAILSSPPFPLMKAAFVDKELTDEEIEALSAMLHFADNHFSQRPAMSTNGLMFFVLSFVFAMFILIHIYILYDNRKVPRNVL